MVKVQKQFNEESMALSKNGARVIEHTLLEKQKNTLNLSVTTKMNSKQIMDLNEKRKTIKCLGEKEKNLCNIGRGKEFLDLMKSNNKKLIN